MRARGADPQPPPLTPHRPPAAAARRESGTEASGAAAVQSDPAATAVPADAQGGSADAAANAASVDSCAGATAIPSTEAAGAAAVQSDLSAATAALATTPVDTPTGSAAPTEASATTEFECLARSGGLFRNQRSSCLYVDQPDGSGIHPGGASSGASGQGHPPNRHAAGEQPEAGRSAQAERKATTPWQRSMTRRRLSGWARIFPPIPAPDMTRVPDRPRPPRLRR